MPYNHHEFMEKALVEANTALKKGEFPVGCVLVHEQKIISHGRRQNSGADPSQPVNEIDHAEVMALRDLLTHHPQIDLSKVTVYATLEPCLMCYATLLISGIRTIVYAYEDAMGGGTTLRLDQLPPLYQSMKVTVVPHIMRGASLALFKQFFSGTGNAYLGDTLLAQYTLEQP